MVKMKAQGRSGEIYTLEMVDSKLFADAVWEVVKAKWYVCNGKAINTEELIWIKDITEDE